MNSNSFFKILEFNKDIRFNFSKERGDKAFFSEYIKKDKSNFYVSSPFQLNSVQLSVLKGTKIYGEIADDFSGALIIFETVIKDMSTLSDFALILSYPTNIQKINRRKYFRTSIIPEPNKILKEFIDDSGFVWVSIPAEIENLSAGGALINSDTYIKKDSIIKIDFEIQSKKYDVYSKVMWVKKLKSKYSYGVEFQDVDDNIQEKILKYTIEKQRFEILKRNHLKGTLSKEN